MSGLYAFARGEGGVRVRVRVRVCDMREVRVYSHHTKICQAYVPIKFKILIRVVAQPCPTPNQRSIPKARIAENG